MKILVAVLAIILLVLLLLFALGFFIKLRIVLTVKKEAGKKMKHNIKYEVSVLGLKKELKFGNSGKKKQEKTEENTEDSKFMNRVKNYYSLFCDFKDIYTKKENTIRKKKTHSPLLLLTELTETLAD